MTAAVTMKDTIHTCKVSHHQSHPQCQSHLPR
jgi:hypothetical protein